MSDISESENPLEAVVVDDAAETKRGRYGWLSLVVAAVFGLLYAYDVWEAIGNFINLPRTYELLGLDQSRIPWWVLVIALLVPIVTYLIAFWVGRRFHVGVKALVFLLGLAVSSAITLGLVALVGVVG